MLLWDDVETPLGMMRALFGDGGLVRLTLPAEDRDLALAVVAAARGEGAVREPAAVAPFAGELEAYLAGGLRAFTVPVDLTAVGGFRREVLRAMAAIPYGEVVSYAELADRAGRPRAVRAAGTACATNPVPVVVPCHRVVRSDGTIGNYGGGPDMKRTLLTLERAPVAVPA